ncbi:MAG: N-6 DNA methylase [bacterium]|nr:N-6 DNA methylase [bacterium]
MVKQFEENREDYHSKKYDESNTRTDFIDKFFEALGWDVRNNQGHAENYREVIREDKIMIEGKQKAPDYAFRIGGTVKFYVEAKKPSVDIKNDIDASYQLRRYAYTAKLPLSILTDFAEFAVYDTRIKPKPTDNASVARIFYCKSDEYEKQWEFIEQTFAKEAILKGSFDKYIKDPKRKKGTSEVDKEFLKQIESWREDLALNIALRNKDLSIYDLNFAIQKIIDRIIFLRIAEDRGMEEYGALRKLSQNSETKFHIYAELVKYFKKADEKYNSGLFDLKEDKVTTKLTIDYKIFANIIDNLYYPNSPYEFSVLPIEILGNIYEQFLGKTIRLTEGHRAKVEDKPEVRKAGGVYYTPQYIVDYIVKNTLGEKLKEKTPKQIEELTVLDPACGSGSFLITAYEYLLNFYLDYYSSDKQRDKALKDKKLFEIGERGYKLGIDEKKEILTRHIYGVDIDSQAVEVTKLSLLLKLMEDERLETSQYLFTRRAMKLLPDLSSNIKCGNSLIGTDFYEGQQVEMFDDEMVRKINAFDWDKQFPKIFSRGGFDVVIGNPPYVFARGESFTKLEKNYYYNKFSISEYQLNTYQLFIEQSYNLMKFKANFGMIIPNNWLTINTFTNLRKFILNKVGDVIIVNNKYKVFQEANVDTSILKFSKSNYKSLVINENDNMNFNLIGNFNTDIFNKDNFIIRVSKIENNNKTILEKIKLNSNSLDCFAVIKSGLVAYEVGKGNPIQTEAMKNDRIYHSKTRIDSHWYKYLEGKDVQRYRYEWNNNWIKYGKWLAAPRDVNLYLKERILVRQIPSLPPYSINSVLVSEKMLINDRNSMIILDLKLFPYFMLACLNSKFTSYWFVHTFDKFQRKTFPQFKVNELASFPIPKCSETEMKKIGERANSLQEMYSKLTDDENNKSLMKKIELINNEIDKMIYCACKLTKEEVEEIENSFKHKQ